MQVTKLRRIREGKLELGKLPLGKWRKLTEQEVAQLLDEVESGEKLSSRQQMYHERTKVRDLAILTLLLGTGIRVSECVGLNIDDVDFQERQCKVFGKGNKEREVYFNARAKIHLQQYISQREDDNPALFVSFSSPHKRLSISGVEVRLRTLGRRINLPKIHPHKFRRTLATMAIDKGMPIEQVQRLLGHVKIDTTLHYAMVNQNNVKIAHRRYIG